jgi:hypothetical protein
MISFIPPLLPETPSRNVIFNFPFQKYVIDRLTEQIKVGELEETFIGSVNRQQTQNAPSHSHMISKRFQRLLS